MTSATDPGLWDAGSPLWSLLAALLGGVIALVGGLIVAGAQRRAEIEHSDRERLREIYGEIHAATLTYYQVTGHRASTNTDTQRQIDAALKLVGLLSAPMVFGSRTVSELVTEFMDAADAVGAAEESDQKQRLRAECVRIIAAIETEMRADLGLDPHKAQMLTRLIRWKQALARRSSRSSQLEPPHAEASPLLSDSASPS